MVKRRYVVFVIFFLMVILSVIVRCRRHSGVYTYHCKEIDFTFQVLEKDTCDVLVLGGSGDSIFYQAPYNGGYLGIDFFLSVDSNIIYLSPYFPVIYNKVEKKYKMQSIKSTFEDEAPCAPYINDKFWNFSGGCDQGRYTFSVSLDKKRYGFIEPLEWN